MMEPTFTYSHDNDRGKLSEHQKIHDLKKQVIRKEQLKSGMTVICKSLIDRSYETQFILRTEPYLDSSNKWVLDVMDSKANSHTIFLSDYGVIPYGKNCWNDSNYMIIKEG